MESQVLEQVAQDSGQCWGGKAGDPAVGKEARGPVPLPGVRVLGAAPRAWGEQVAQVRVRVLFPIRRPSPDEYQEPGTRPKAL